MKTKSLNPKQTVCCTTRSKRTAAAAVFLFPIVSALADQHTAGTPALSSKPGAAYTLYFDFAGFNYNGAWAEFSPGLQAPYDGAAANGTFNAGQISDIKFTWAFNASLYSAFNINVTTVDPAPAGLTDAQRQTFYNNTPNFMHTIFTVPGWAGAGGYSAIGNAVGTASGTDDFTVQHTAWVLYGPGNGNPFAIAVGAGHENGHALGLIHQSDYVGETLINEYSSGDSTVDGSATGPGTYAAIMGGRDQQRFGFRAGSSDNDNPGHFQNDIIRMLTNQTAAEATAAGRTGGVDLHLVGDAIGHTLATASALPLNADGTVNFSLATGVIIPNSESDPNPTGAANYTKDFFTFTLASAQTISLTAHDGTQFLTPGVADEGVALRSVLKIYNAAGSLLATATEDASTLFETYGGLLAAGTYYASVESAGGHQQVNLENPAYEPSTHYDMGGYFLSGSGFTVPEPGTACLLLLGMLGFAARRPRPAAQRA